MILVIARDHGCTAKEFLARVTSLEVTEYLALYDIERREREDEINRRN